MNNFYNKFKSPLFVLMIIVALAGVYSYQNMKTELFPNVTFPKIKVIADNGEQPVGKMMISVTRPLEEAIKKSENLTLLKSITSRGSCEISAFYHWKSNINLAQQQISERIAEIRNDLPPGTKIQIEQMNPSISPVEGYSLEGDKSPIELRMLALYTVKPYLEQISGIREVDITGGKIKEYQLVLDQQKMSRLGITPEMVDAVLKQTNFIKANGYVDDFRRLYLSLTNANIENLDQLRNTVIRSTPTGVIRIKDFAHVQIGEQRQYVRIKANGKNVPLIAILKQPEANLMNLNQQIQQRIKALNDHILPKGVHIRPFYNQATFVGSAIKSIRDVLWIGLLLAIVVTIVFLRSLKSSFIILVSVPLSLAFSIVLLHAFGFDFNIMTLGALAAAIALVIDDSVVIVEQIHRTHEENPDEDFKTVVPKAIKYLFPAMVGSSLSTIVIFLPFGIMSGVAGAYFNIMTETMIITLTASFLVTWIGLPVFYLVFFPKTTQKHSQQHALKKRNWVGFFIHRPYIAVSMVLASLLIMYIVYPRLPSGFLPYMDEGSIVLDFVSPPGTTLQETEVMLEKIDHILATIPEVNSYSRRTGTQMGFFITEPNTGDYLIQLKRKRKLTTDQVIDEIRKKVESEVPALQVDFGQVITDKLGDLMSSVQPISIKIFGDNENVIRHYAEQIADVVSSVRGTADVFDGVTIAGPEIEVRPNIAKLGRFGMTPQDLQYQLQTRTDGTVVGTIQDPMQFTDVRMIYPNRDSTGVEAVKKGKLFLPDGRLVPMKGFATVQTIPGVPEIDRENLKKVDYVTARLNNRDLGSTLKDIQKAISEKISLPQGYTIEYGGAYEQQQKAFQELELILFLAALLVFTVILFLFKRLKVALLIIFLTLLGPTGSALLLYFFNIPLNVGSYVGIIMIVGIVGEASIFTYLQYNEERKRGRSVDESIIYSISIRLRPKLMTALGAIFALLPLAMGIGTGAQMHQPLAVAVIGGLLMALPVLLIALPTFLRIMEKADKPKSITAENTNE
ncbi:MAG: efflux RND transporter permease subunit [Bacteroidales bacterium]|nr:efflux RND transporter permease subunit [Bacteroidales bacterium]